MAKVNIFFGFGSPYLRAVVGPQTTITLALSAALASISLYSAVLYSVQCSTVCSVQYCTWVHFTRELHVGREQIEAKICPHKMHCALHCTVEGRIHSVQCTLDAQEWSGNGKHFRQCQIILLPCTDLYSPRSFFSPSKAWLVMLGFFSPPRTWLILKHKISQFF